MSINKSRREFLRSALLVTGLGSGILLIAACGGGNAASTQVASTGKTYNFDLSSGDEIHYNQEKLEAESGSMISVTFTNKSTDKLLNWVLVKPGKMLRVATDGAMENEANGYLKQGSEDIIAHTKLTKAGESDTITFAAPEPGVYQFLCTFPGYYTRMNGTLTIT